MHARRPLEIPSGRLRGQRWRCVPSSVVRSLGTGRCARSPLHREPLLVRRRTGSGRDLGSQPSGAEGAGEAAGGGLRGRSGCPARTPAGKGPPGLPPGLPKPLAWGAAARCSSARPPGGCQSGIPGVLGELEARVLQAKSLDVQMGTIGVKPLDLELATSLRRALIGWGLEGSGRRGGKGFRK